MIITATCWPCMGWAYCTVSVVNQTDQEFSVKRSWTKSQAWLWGDEEDWNVHMLGMATELVGSNLLAYGEPPHGWVAKQTRSETT